MREHRKGQHSVLLPLDLKMYLLSGVQSTWSSWPQSHKRNKHIQQHKTRVLTFLSLSHREAREYRTKILS